MSDIKYKVGEKWTFFRTIHIIVGVLIIVMSIIAFINPLEHRLAFPAIFAMAGLLNFLTFFEAIRKYPGNQKKLLIGLTSGLMGLVLSVIAIIAVISL